MGRGIHPEVYRQQAIDILQGFLARPNIELCSAKFDMLDYKRKIVVATPDFAIWAFRSPSNGGVVGGLKINTKKCEYPLKGIMKANENLFGFATRLYKEAEDLKVLKPLGALSKEEVKEIATEIVERLLLRGRELYRSSN